MNITEITSKAGGHRRKKRVGRGESSGHGKTSTRGNKGAGARTGTPGTMGLKEGGQTPLFKRLPKRGFSNFRFRKVYSVVNVADLQKEFDDGATVNAAALAAAGLIRDAKDRVKLLGDGAVTKKFRVEVHKASRQAAEKIKAAGGDVQTVG
jgi:large subunit ribosomal protein L15